MENEQVSDFFSPSLITIPAEAPLARAASLMTTHKIRHLPVTRGAEIVGIISNRDVQRATQVAFFPWGELYAEERDISPSLTVENFMRSPIESVEAATSLGEAAGRMIRLKISSLLVTKNAAPIGIITTDDMLGVIVKHFQVGSPTPLSQWESWKSEIFENSVGKLIQELSLSGI